MNKLDVKIYSRSGSLPQYQTPGASGVDLHFDSEIPVTISQGEAKLLSTGIFVEIPQGFEIQVRSRSGLAAKNNMFVLNSPGTVDADYRGEIKVILYNASEFVQHVSPGDRIAQMVLCPIMVANFVQVESQSDLSDTSRGSGGFGSTGVSISK